MLRRLRPLLIYLCRRRCRDALWRVLFWQPLLQGAGLLLVALLALAGALWASLQIASLWQVLRWAGGGAREGGVGRSQRISFWCHHW